MPLRILIFVSIWALPTNANCQVDRGDLSLEEEKQREEVDFGNKSPEENWAIINDNIKFYKENENWERYILALNNKSMYYYYSKDYSDFIPHSKMAMELAEEKAKPDSIAYLYALMIRAFAYELVGDFENTIKLQKKSAELSKNLLDKYAAYDNNGITYELLGDYDEAIRNYEYALNILDEASRSGEFIGKEVFEPHYKGEVLRQIATCYKEKGEYQIALRKYKNSLGHLMHLPREPYYLEQVWKAYLGLSDLYLKKENSDSAMYFSRLAIAIQENTEDISDSYLTYVSHGDILLFNNDYTNAHSSFSKSLEIATLEYDGFEKHSSFATCLNKMAKTYFRKGEYKMAQKFCQDALQKITVNFNSNKYSENPLPGQYIIKQNGLEILVNKAEILTRLSEEENNSNLYLETAHKTYIAAINLIQSIRQDYLAEGSKHTMSEKALPICEKAIGTALMLYEIDKNEIHLENIFSIAEANKATLLYESIKNNRAKGFAGIPDSLLEKEKELITNRNFYQKLIKEEHQKKEGADLEKIKSSEKLVFELDAELGKLIEEMETNYPEYLEQKKQTVAISLNIVRSNLPNDHTAFVEYMVGIENAYVLFLTKNNLAVIIINEFEKLEERIRRLQELVNSPPSSNKFSEEYTEYTNLSYSLYAQLLAEGLEKIPKEINKLIIVPDDILSYLSYEILLREKPKNIGPDYSPKSLSYLMEDFNISYQYSANLMTANKKNKLNEKNKKAFVGFAPDFEGGYALARSCNAGQLSSLLCNKEEVTKIQQIIGGDIFVSGQSGLDNFMENAPNCRILHLATHACVDDSDAGLNKIYLSDGDISQYELGNLKLNTDLTVLSACNTGMGQLLKGEGIMSLTRNFMLAGSKSVLTSLWSVDDCATADIMVDYYSFLKKGMAKDKALSKAKLEYLKNADPINSHPYYWAGFVQFGNVEPLDIAGSDYWYLIIALLFIGTGFIYWKKRIG